MSSPDAKPEQPQRDPWETALEGLELITLDPASCKLRWEPSGRMAGVVGGREHADVVAYRAFPLSQPGCWVSLVAVADRDSDGRRSDGGRSDHVEVGVLPDLAGLDPESRAAVETSLRLRYFMPRVLEIISVIDEDPGQSGAVQWELRTDRGPMRLRMPNLWDGIEEIDEKRVLLRDHDGNRAEIADVGALDPASRKLLERYYWF